MLLIAPTFSLVAIAVTVRSSAKAKTIEEAQQRAVFLIFPILALVIGQFTGILLINSWLLLGLGAVLVVLDVLLMRNAAGLTAWIVNHQDVIPGFVNRLAHLFFFVFMDLTIIITAEYMYEQLIELIKTKQKLSFCGESQVCLSLLLITAGIGKLGTSGQDYLVFYGLLSVCLLRDNHILLWNDSVSGDNKASFSPKRKSNGNIILYPDCRTDTGCTDPFSGSTSYFHIPNCTAAWNLY